MRTSPLISAEKRVSDTNALGKRPRILTNYWGIPKKSFSVTQRGGGNKEGREQMRANANKRRQTLTNASKRRGKNASKQRANVDKGKQTLTPPFIVFGLHPLYNDNTIPLIQKRPFVHNSVCSQFLEGLFAILAECSQFCLGSF